MTVSSTNTSKSYTGDGSTTEFAYDFKIFDDDDIVVIIKTTATGAEAVKTKTTHYAVSGVGATSGGNVTFTSGNVPTSAQTILLIRSTALSQLTDYTPNDPFPAATHEDALDKLTLVTQDIQAELNRAIKLSRSNSMTSTEFATTPTNRANQILGFDGSGELTVTEGKVDSVTISASAVSVGGSPTATVSYTASSGALAFALGLPTGATGATGSSADLAGDASPQLGGNLDLVTHNIITTSNRSINLIPNGTGDVNLSADTVKIGDADANATITTNGTGDLILNTNSGTNSGTITIADGANGLISIAPNGSGTFQITANTIDFDGDLDVSGDAVVGDDITVAGRASGHVTTDDDGSFDLAVGNDFKCTTAGGLTLTFTNPLAGQSGNIMFINGGNHAIAAHASVAVSTATLTAISATGTYHLAYYCSAASGNNTILVSASAALT